MFHITTMTCSRYFHKKTSSNWNYAIASLNSANDIVDANASLQTSRNRFRKFSKKNNFTASQRLPQAINVVEIAFVKLIILPFF